MGTTIDAVAVATGYRGAPALTGAAARACLDEAGLGPGDVELLVNAGLYHDRNLGEPALAALIQEDIGANPEDPHDGGHGTFSFDVANGACGLLTGLRVAHGFLAAGTIRHALVVAGDADPGRRQARRFPFAPAGAAIACGWSDEPVGLTDFRFASRPGADALFHAEVDLQRGRNRLRIEEAPEFAARAASLAADVAIGLLADHRLQPRDVDFVVANPLAAAFVDALEDRLGPAAPEILGPNGWEPVHTAGLAVAWDEARRKGRLAGASKVLLVSAGAGLIAGAALFRG